MWAKFIFKKRRVEALVAQTQAATLLCFVNARPLPRRCRLGRPPAPCGPSHASASPRPRPPATLGPPSLRLSFPLSRTGTRVSTSSSSPSPAPAGGTATEGDGWGGAGDGRRACALLAATARLPPGQASLPEASLPPGHPGVCSCSQRLPPQASVAALCPHSGELRWAVSDRRAASPGGPGHFRALPGSAGPEAVTLQRGAEAGPWGQAMTDSTRCRQTRSGPSAAQDGQRSRRGTCGAGDAPRVMPGSACGDNGHAGQTRPPVPAPRPPVSACHLHALGRGRDTLASSSHTWYDFSSRFFRGFPLRLTA